MNFSMRSQRKPTPGQANILAELEAEGEIHVALVYRGTPENAQKFISAQEKYLEELALKNEKEDNSSKPEVPQKPSQSEITEENSDESIPENNSGIDKIIIDPENNSDTNPENSTDNTETEVTSNGESV